MLDFPSQIHDSFTSQSESIYQLNTSTFSQNDQVLLSDPYHYLKSTTKQCLAIDRKHIYVNLTTKTHDQPLTLTNLTPFPLQVTFSSHLTLLHNNVGCSCMRITGAGQASVLVRTEAGEEMGDRFEIITIGVEWEEEHRGMQDETRQTHPLQSYDTEPMYVQVQIHSLPLLLKIKGLCAKDSHTTKEDMLRLLPNALGQYSFVLLSGGPCSLEARGNITLLDHKAVNGIKVRLTSNKFKEITKNGLKKEESVKGAILVKNKENCAFFVIGIQLIGV